MKMNYFKLAAVAILALWIGHAVYAGSVSVATRAVSTMSSVTTNIYTSVTTTNYPTSGASTNITTTTVITTNSTRIIPLDDVSVSLTVTNKGSFPMYLSMVNPVIISNALIVIGSGASKTWPNSTTPAARCV